MSARCTKTGARNRVFNGIYLNFFGYPRKYNILKKIWKNVLPKYDYDEFCFIKKKLEIKRINKSKLTVNEIHKSTPLCFLVLSLLGILSSKHKRAHSLIKVEIFRDCQEIQENYEGNVRQMVESDHRISSK